MPTPEHNGTTRSDTLHGWKDIANYLGRSTRAVQRWEDELNLPVHRIQGANGPTVYAHRAELDDWKKSRDLPKPQPEDDEAAAGVNGNLGPEPPPSETLPPARPSQAGYLRWLTHGAVAAAAFLAGLALAHAYPSVLPGPIATVQVAGTTVTTFDAAGRIVWRTDMGEQVEEWGVNSSAPIRFIAGSGLEATRQGDIIVPIRFGAPSAHSDAVVTFDERKGTVRWKVQPSISLRCGAETFAGPWELATQVRVSQDRKHPRIWVAFNNHTYWPGLLFEVDPAGVSTLRYVQAGWIRDLSEWTSDEGHMVVVNGVLNEAAQASTTLLKADGPLATSPHSDPRFSCGNVPPVPPSAVFLWPTLDVLGPEAYPMATNVKPLSDGLQVLLEQGGGGTIIEMDTAARVRSLTLPDAYWVVHRQRQAEGWIKHPAESCPERSKPQPFETWTPQSGWRHSTIVPTNRQSTRR